MKRILLLAGPTAVGKTEVSLMLAERLNAEIVSVDSMQVYRGLDIGTAKPSAEEQQRVRHHLLDVVELSEWFDAAQFAHLAKRAVQEIHDRGRLALLCGGTGLYFQVFLGGVGTAPPADFSLRAELQKIPLPELLRELAELDPVTYQQIDQKNPRRVIRAVEVIRLTGKPFSAQRVGWRQEASGNEGKAANCPFVVLTRSNPDLQARINDRVEAMFRRGLVEETKQLLGRGLAGNMIALQALGYRQVVEYLQGERGLPETIELVKRRTRQFAKRQLTWFRHQAQAHWVTAEPEEPAEDVARRIETFLRD